MRILLDIHKKPFILYNIRDSYIKNNLSNESVADSDLLIDYLKKSEPFSVTLDSIKCIISNVEIEDHYETLMTDGYWIWSADLLHYTKNHKFKWPIEFLKYLKSVNYKTYTLSREDMANLYFDKYKSILDEDEIIDTDKVEMIDLK